MFAPAAAWEVGFVTCLVSLSLSDCAHRRVSNLLCSAVALGGLTEAGIRAGSSGMALSAAGVGAAGAALLPLYIVGWGGAGDIKASAALGAWAGGAALALHALVLGLCVGGAISALIILFDARPYVERMLFATHGGRAGPALLRARREGKTLPLVAALAVGSWLGRVGGA